jgi:hypothetical protein
MPRDLIEHVIEESDAGGKLGRAPSRLSLTLTGFQITGHGLARR